MNNNKNELLKNIIVEYLIDHIFKDKKYEL